MKVPDVSGLVRGLDPRDAHRSSQIQDSGRKSDTISQDGDALDISLSSVISSIINTSSVDGGNELPPISAEKVAEIRSRIQSGVYDRPDVAEATTAKILEFYSH